MKSIVNVMGKVNANFNNIANIVALQTIKLLGQPDCFELTIKFVSENEIQKLNSDFRNIDKVTDVLSFPALNIKAGEKFCEQKNEIDQTEEGLFYLGDMAICTKRLKEQAKSFGLASESELKKLVIHSILHLFGYDHIKDADYLVMNEKETMFFDKIKIEGEL